MTHWATKTMPVIITIDLLSVELLHKCLLSVTENG